MSRSRASTLENRLRSRLARRQFALILEIVPPPPGNGAAEAEIEGLMEAVGSRDEVAAIAVTDRVVTDYDRDSAEFGLCIARRTGRQPLVHVAGKARGLADVLAAVQRMQAWGLENALLLTGDRIKDREREQQGPVRYFDSVNLVQAFRERFPTALLGAACNPFKRTPEDFANQMLKMEKKVRAGADLIITQVGFSWRVYRSFLEHCARRFPGVAVLAGATYLPKKVARGCHGGYVPGITVSDALLQQVEADSQTADPVARYVRRLAIQVVTFKALGYAGTQVGGIHTRAVAEALLTAVAELEAQQLSVAELTALWEEVLPGCSGEAPAADTGEGLPLVPATWRERLRYRTLDAVDHVFFADSLTGRATGALIRWLSGFPAASRLLEQVEHAAKSPVVGCQMCGFCRLPFTMYVCPETCPKGLANGPCGGTSDGTCEFGDRPCIHNRKYRAAVAAGRVRELAEVIIPQVPEELRGSSSWINHARANEPQVTGSTDSVNGKVPEPPEIRHASRPGGLL